MRVLVTGNRGFIANKLVDRLKLDENIDQIIGVNRQGGLSIETGRSSKEKFVEVYCQLQNEAHVQSLLRWIKPNVIYHVAARQESTAEGYLENVQATLNLLRFAPQELKRFIYASSSTVYGDLSKDFKTVFDQHVFEWYRTLPTSLYGASKLAGESIVGAYTVSNNIESCILRYVATVGYGATHGVLPDIINKLKGDNPELELFGDDPGSIKPYIHIDDLINATHFLGQSTHKGIYNITPLNSISIKELALVVMETMNIKKPLKWLGKSHIKVGDNQLVRINGNKIWASHFGRNMKYKKSEEAVMAATKEYVGVNL